MLSQSPITDSTAFQSESCLLLPIQAEGRHEAIATSSHHPSCTTVANLGAIAGARSWAVRYVPEGSAGRAEAEALIHSRYQSIHGATVGTCMPHLYAISAPDEGIAGAVGIRMMEQKGGLVERYLDHPIELLLKDLTDQPINREDLVEVGNLAAANIPVAVLLIAFLFEECSRLGRSHAVFTGTHAVRLALRRAKVPHQIIQPADPNRLGADKDEWGRYYECDPHIIVVDVAAGLARIRDHFWISRVPTCGS